MLRTGINISLIITAISKCHGHPGEWTINKALRPRFSKSEMPIAFNTTEYKLMLLMC